MKTSTEPIHKKNKDSKINSFFLPTEGKQFNFCLLIQVRHAAQKGENAGFFPGCEIK
jgi:hypothetical protein